MIKTKKCPECKTEKPLEKFYLYKGKASSYCQFCSRWRGKMHYIMNKDIIREKARVRAASMHRVCTGPCGRELKLTEENFYKNTPRKGRRAYHAHELGYWRGECKVCVRERISKNKKAVREACAEMRRMVL